MEEWKTAAYKSAIENEELLGRGSP